MRAALFVVPVGVVASLLAVPASAQEAHKPHPAKIGDYNGDGRRDLATGAPGLNGDKGGVVVHLGGPKRVAATGKVITRDTAGVPGTRKQERFGEHLASADFNGDGYSELVVGVPGAGWKGQAVVLRGSRKGVTGQKTVTLTPPEGLRYSHFGDAMAVGDFNVDGYPDLAVADDDRVRVFRGGSQGLSWKRSAELANGQSGFGRLLASGDVDGDGATDLAVVSESVNTDEEQQEGRLTVVPGHRGDGLRLSRSWFVKLGTTTPWSLSVGDVNGDHRADFVTSVRESDVGWTVLYRPSWGRSFGPPWNFQEYVSPFATALGDLNGDGYADLAVRSEDRDANAIVVFPGGKNAFYAYATRNWKVPILKLGLSSTENASLSIMNVSGGSRRELIIGDPYASAKKGALLVLHSGRAKNAQLLRSPWKHAASYGASLVRTDGTNTN